MNTNTGAVKVREQWVLGPDATPFWTTEYSPANEQPKAYIVFCHGFAEHIGRYVDFFPRLAAPPSSLHITAFDQRGHGLTSLRPLTLSSPEVQAWQSEGKTVKLEGDKAKRRTGGWARVMPDIEWFVQRESERAKQTGVKLFLWGFSMGGGQSIGFVTRPQSPPSEETVGLLSGVIAGGPLIRLTKAAPQIQVKIGTLAAYMGLGNMIMPTPLNYDALSHNSAANDGAKNDPLCEQVGTLRGISDFLNYGNSLCTSAVWDKWPKTLPLLVYHGAEDEICDAKASQEFVEGLDIKDKQIKVFEGMFHEIHHEFEPIPGDLVQLVTEWVHQRAGVEAPTASITARL